MASLENMLQFSEGAARHSSIVRWCFTMIPIIYSSSPLLMWTIEAIGEISLQTRACERLTCDLHEDAIGSLVHIVLSPCLLLSNRGLKGSATVKCSYPLP